MKVHTTNYQNTFITVADDCRATQGEVPPVKGDDKTIANLQFDLLYDHPYKYTSDDIVFHCYAAKNKIPKAEQPAAREQFFSKGQPCLRTSPLSKRYGFGTHHNEEGKVALYAMESPEYAKLMKDKGLKVIKAIKSSR
ncbi:DUF6157 family protein [Chitinophaga horti]|uniref:DUF6157 family protein n=1 Tax=Chitinophaga horti TaxID=2920382 RepID=A0ABY6IZQ0_9BACT|nr:DUF6157 family protein [Chitinophaga horti]UYQ92656.1 DUF6157 family protein [Chitinophaga horti]